MVSVSYVYNTILDLIRKDQHGKAFEIDEYNNVIRLVNIELYNQLADKAEADQGAIDDMKDLFQLNQSVTLDISGVGDLAAGYDRLLGKPWWLSGTSYYPIDVITSLEFADRMKDTLTAPTTTHPVCIIGDLDESGNSQIKVYPTTGIATIYMNYLSVPATPFLDYYVDAYGTYTYMAAGATSVSIPSGSVYRDGSIGPTSKNSSTVEFAWDSAKTSILINMILQKAGIALQNQIPVQYGMAREVKEQSQ